MNIKTLTDLQQILKELTPNIKTQLRKLSAEIATIPMINFEEKAIDRLTKENEKRKLLLDNINLIKDSINKLIKQVEDERFENLLQFDMKATDPQAEIARVYKDIRVAEDVISEIKLLQLDLEQVKKELEASPKITDGIGLHGPSSIEPNTILGESISELGRQVEALEDRIALERKTIDSFKKLLEDSLKANAEHEGRKASSERAKQQRIQGKETGDKQWAKFQEKLKESTQKHVEWKQKHAEWKISALSSKEGIDRRNIQLDQSKEFRKLMSDFRSENPEKVDTSRIKERLTELYEKARGYQPVEFDIDKVKEQALAFLEARPLFGEGLDAGTKDTIKGDAKAEIEAIIKQENAKYSTKHASLTQEHESKLKVIVDDESLSNRFKKIAATLEFRTKVDNAKQECFDNQKEAITRIVYKKTRQIDQAVIKGMLGLEGDTRSGLEDEEARERAYIVAAKSKKSEPEPEDETASVISVLDAEAEAKERNQVIAEVDEDERGVIEQRETGGRIKIEEEARERIQIEEEEARERIQIEEEKNRPGLLTRLRQIVAPPPPVVPPLRLDEVAKQEVDFATANEEATQDQYTLKTDAINPNKAKVSYKPSDDGKGIKDRHSLVLEMVLLTYVSALKEGHIPILKVTNGSDVNANLYYAYAEILKASGLELEIDYDEKLKNQELIDKLKGSGVDHRGKKIESIAERFKVNSSSPISDRDKAIAKNLMGVYMGGEVDYTVVNHVLGKLGHKPDTKTVPDSPDSPRFDEVVKDKGLYFGLHSPTAEEDSGLSARYGGGAKFGDLKENVEKVERCLTSRTDAQTVADSLQELHTPRVPRPGARAC